jgi:hypothetical protein
VGLHFGGRGAFSRGTAVWNGDVPNNVVANSGSPPNPNVWWQPTAGATAPVAYDVNLGQPTAVSAATTTWYPGYFPSACKVDTSPDGLTWSTQLSFTANTAASRTDVFPGGQVTARYLRLLITAFPSAGQFSTQTTVRYVQYVVTSLNSGRSQLAPGDDFPHVPATRTSGGATARTQTAPQHAGNL